MLQVTLDPSSLLFITKEAENAPTAAKVVLSLSGLSWKKDAGFPKEWQEDTGAAKKYLYPWHWDLPTHIRIFWMIKECNATGCHYQSTSFADLEVLQPDLSSYDNDREKLKAHYDKILSSKLFSKNAPFIRKNELFASLDAATKQVIEVDDNVTIPGEDTHFYNGTTAHFAQQLSPLNQALQFVLFSSTPGNSASFEAPDLCVGFVAFPYNKDPGSRWEPVTDIDLPLRSNDFKVDDTDQLGQCTVQYKMYSDINMIAYCPVTPLPAKPAALNDPIQLRDEKGDFSGTVKVQVNDIDDQSAALLSVTGPFFDLPALFISFLEKNRDRFKYESGTDPELYKIRIGRFGDFLWAATRDSNSFGYIPESDNNSIVQRIARQYADDQSGKVETLAPEKQAAYWKAFNATSKALKDLLKTTDTEAAFNLAAWKKLVTKNIFDREEEIIKIEEEANAQKVARLNPGISSVVENLEKTITSIQAGATVELVNESVSNWLLNWRRFLSLLQNDPILQSRIRFEQWYPVDLKPAGIDLDRLLNTDARPAIKVIAYLSWYEKIFLDAGELQELQKESISTLYKEKLLASFSRSINATKEAIAADCIAALEQYLDQRIDPSNKIFFPLAKDPFEPVAAPVPAGFPTWAEFKNSVQQERTGIENAILKELQVTANIPPALQLRVDKPKETGSLTAEDLNDEIAGHIVLIRRADTIFGKQFQNNSWRYLNRAKLNAVVVRPPTPDAAFEAPYIIPAFLPEMDGNKISSLQLSNERLSLVAGHNSFNDSYDANNTGDQQQAYFEYLFDDTHPGYALWYGYEYEFAGFVALNSGILPPQLRTGKVWNVPKEQPDDPLITGTVYPYLRRVPVSKVRVDVQRTGGKPILPLPNGLRPLAFELPEWKGNNDIPGLEKMPNEQVHYLLAKGNSYQQESITMILKKPTTNFQNWYAWVGEGTKIKTSISFTDNKNRIIGEKGSLLDKNDYQVADNGNRILDGAGNPIKDTPVLKSVGQLAQERDIQKRMDLNSTAGSEKEALCDPAVENIVCIVIQNIFPVKKENDLGRYFIQLNNTRDRNDENSLIDDFQNKLPVNITDADTSVEEAGGFIKTINVKKGEILRIYVHGLVRKDYLKKFYSWMDSVVSDNLKLVQLPGNIDCYLSKPVEIFVEAAKKPEIMLPATDKAGKLLLGTSDLLWRRLAIEQDRDKIKAFIEKDNDTLEFSYTSRMQVSHQVWNWNGRLDESSCLLTRPGPLDPVDGLTTPAMEWEAWAFSDRPDFSALVHETNLLAFRPGDVNAARQEVFTDHRPGEEKALYYRFSASLFSRYELLGDDYKAVIESNTIVDINKINKKEVGTNNKWRRFLRKSNKTKRLPKPSIRFVIPLTKSINECNDAATIGAAALLVVLNDRWFAEAGLSENFEMGIDILKNPLQGAKDEYLNAGNDPVLTGRGMGKVKQIQVNGKEKYPYIEEEPGKNKIAVFGAAGPLGLTYDFAAHTPRLKGCAFIVEVPPLGKLITGENKKADNELKPWSLMQVAVRRGLNETLCEPGTGIPSLYSEWTAKEWVQFLPATDYFIPGNWKRTVAMEKSVTLQHHNQGRGIDIMTNGKADNNLPLFDTGFEDHMERFLVLTEKVYDMGGQPCERYVATYKFDSVQKTFTIDPPGATVNPFETKIEEGYLRVLLVRSKAKDSKQAIWQRLFGENASQKTDPTTVQDDPTAALPIVSERVPYKL